MKYFATLTAFLGYSGASLLITVSRAAPASTSIGQLAARQIDTTQRAKVASAQLEPVQYVFRGARRDLQAIRAAGGFLPRVVNPDNPGAYGLWDHLNAFFDMNSGNTIPYSQYISTSTSFAVAARFAVQPGGTSVRAAGWIYHIHVTPNMVDVSKSLLEHYDTAEEMEIAALGGILISQIKGCVPIPENYNWKAAERDPQRAFEQLSHLYVKNPDYDVKFEQYSISGGQPQLAGFPENDVAWAREPWSAFKPSPVRSTKDYAIEFMNRVGSAVGWQKHFPLLEVVEKKEGKQEGEEEREKKEKEEGEREQREREQREREERERKKKEERERMEREEREREEKEEREKEEKEEREKEEKEERERKKQEKEKQEKEETKKVEEVKNQALDHVDEMSNSGIPARLKQALVGAGAGLGVMGLAGIATAMAVGGGTAPGAASLSVGSLHVDVGSSITAETAQFSSAEAISTATQLEIASMIAQVNPALGIDMMLELAPETPTTALKRELADAEEASPHKRTTTSYSDKSPEHRAARKRWVVKAIGPAMERALLTAFELGAKEARQELGV